MDTFTTISGFEMLVLLRQRYPYAMILPPVDTDYNIPTEESFEVYKKELGALLFDQFGDKWQTFFDCDKITLTALAFAYRKHFIARYAGKGSAEGLAMGFIRLTLTPGDLTTNHQTCFRIDGSKKVREWEPQNRVEYNLTQQQCDCVSLVYI